MGVMFAGVQRAHPRCHSSRRADAGAGAGSGPELSLSHAQETWGKCDDDGVKEYLAHVGKFSDLLTEAVHSLEGGVELPVCPAALSRAHASLRPTSVPQAAPHRGYRH